MFTVSSLLEEESTEFLRGWYGLRNPDVAAAVLRGEMTASYHFERYGWREGRDPGPLFDTSFYLGRYADVAAEGVNPLTHYLQYGADEGRIASPFFDESYYLTRYSDVAAAVTDGTFSAYEHFRKHGFDEGRDPFPLLDEGYYLEHNRDVAASEFSAFQHYVTFGQFENRAPSASFQPYEYAAVMRQQRLALGDAPDFIQHYLTIGAGLGLPVISEILAGDADAPTSVGYVNTLEPTVVGSGIVDRMVTQNVTDWSFSAAQFFTDVDMNQGDALTYSIAANYKYGTGDLTSWTAVDYITLDPLYGTLSINRALLAGDRGAVYITVRATDSGGLTVDESFELFVADNSVNTTGTWNPGPGVTSGDDTISGTAVTAEWFWGDEGADSINGQHSIDTAHGGEGADTITGFNHGGLMYGGADNDSITGAGDTDYIYGGDGNDTIYAGSLGGADVVYGGSGADSIRSNNTLASNLTLYGDSGNDTIEFVNVSVFNSSDTVSGGTGTDIFCVTNHNTGALTANFANGQWDKVSGIEIFDLQANAAHSLTFNDQYITRGGFEGNTLTVSASTVATGITVNASGITDSSYAVSVTGGSANDTITGTAGNDTISTADGADSIVAGAGSDSVNAGIGNDYVQAGTGANTVFGGTGNDTITAQYASSADRNLIYGEDGADSISSSSGTDTIYGGNDDDSIDAKNGNDFVYGGDGADTLDGGIHLDQVYGGAGNDLILAHTGAGFNIDMIDGGDGNDTLQAGIRTYSGNGNKYHTLTGGIGADTFVFSNVNQSGLVANAEAALITDFSGNWGEGDKLDLGAVSGSGLLWAGSIAQGSSGNAFAADNSMRYYYDAANNYTVVQITVATADANAATVDMEIILQGLNSITNPLTLADFTGVASNGFTDITTAAGVGDTNQARGTSFFDYDNDGDLDLYLVNNAVPKVLYRNNGDGTFTDVAVAAGVATSTTVGNIAVGDFDGDGDLDISVAIGNAANALYRNNGNGTFTDIAVAAGVNNASVTASAPFADIDGDGDLDMYVVNTGSANVLYRNNGNSTFTDITGAAGVGYNSVGNSAIFGDIDGDGDLDMYITNNGAQANVLYRNNGNSTFTDISVAAGVANTGNSNGTAFGDYDNDGDLDLYVTNVGGLNALYRNNGNSTFTNVTATAGVGNIANGYATAWLDYDNDGDLDLYVVNALSNNILYQNNGDGTFSNVAAGAGVTNAAAHGIGLSVGDIDNDGDIDIYIGNHSGANVLYRNDSNPATTSYVTVNLLDAAGKATLAGITGKLYNGSTLVATRTMDGGSGKGSQNATDMHFAGLDASTSYTLQVTFPNGMNATYDVGTPDGLRRSFTQGQILNGTIGTDSIVGGNGSDSIFGDQGSDTIRGGAGNDTIYGGQTLNAAQGPADTLEGGTGSDVFFYSYHRDSNVSYGSDLILDFIQGEDKIQLDGLPYNGIQAGAPVVETTTLGYTYDAINDWTVILGRFAATQNDYIYIRVSGNVAFSNSDFLFTNLIEGSGSGALINDTASDDALIGTSGNDTIFSTAYETVLDTTGDQVFGGQGDDLIFIKAATYGAYVFAAGNEGNDQIFAGGISGHVHYSFGGDGNDTVYGNPEWVKLDAGDDVLYGGREGITHKLAGTGNDTMYGGEGNDGTFNSNPGFLGENGDDVLHGGYGWDRMSGGSNLNSAGQDTFLYYDPLESSSTETDIIHFFTIGTGVDSDKIVLHGFTGIAAGAAAGTTLGYSFDGTHTVITSIAAYNFQLKLVGDYTATFDIPNDFEFRAGILGTNGADGTGAFAATGSGEFIFGLEGNDTIDAGGGNDSVFGGHDADSLAGGLGDDSISGGYLNDTLIGGGGADTLEGGSGADTFVFGAGDSTGATPDVIWDFKHGSDADIIDLSALGLSGFSDLTIAYTSGIFTQITTAGGLQINLLGYYESGTDLTATDFVF